jgi:hypothetical protein
MATTPHDLHDPRPPRPRAGSCRRCSPRCGRPADVSPVEHQLGQLAGRGDDSNAVATTAADIGRAWTFDKVVASRPARRQSAVSPGDGRLGSADIARPDLSLAHVWGSRRELSRLLGTGLPPTNCRCSSWAGVRVVLPARRWPGRPRRGRGDHQPGCPLLGTGQ